MRFIMTVRGQKLHQLKQTLIPAETAAIDNRLRYVICIWTHSLNLLLR
jgi:hypothetical protein